MCNSYVGCGNWHEAGNDGLPVCGGVSGNSACSFKVRHHQQHQVSYSCYRCTTLFHSVVGNSEYGGHPSGKPGKIGEFESKVKVKHAIWLSQGCRLGVHLTFFGREPVAGYITKSVMHGQCIARATIVIPAAECNCCFTRYKLCCLVTEV